MRSEAQIQASRINGANSRGPITAQGKKNSSLNGLKHGLTARTVVLCNEDHSLFEKLQQRYIDSLQPTNYVELELIHRMVAAQWRMKRLWTVGAALADADMVLNRHKDEADNPELDQDFRLSLAQKRVSNDLTPMQLNEARLERSHDRGLNQYNRLRQFRPPNATVIQHDCSGVSTTGRDPTEYFFPRSKPKPAVDTNAQTTSQQQLAAREEIPPSSEPKK